MTTSGTIFPDMPSDCSLALHLSHCNIITCLSVTYKPLKLFLLPFYFHFTAQYLIPCKGIKKCKPNKWMAPCFLQTVALFFAHVLSWSRQVQFLCNPMDCSSPGSSFPEVSQARILELVAMPSSREVFPPRDQIHLWRPPSLVSRFFTATAVWEACPCFVPNT